MKVLLINKFLYPNGGSETYIFKLGEHLLSEGHEVQYFGMEHEGRIVGNRVDSYTADMDFHGGSKLSKLTYPIKTVYSSEARKKLRKVLDDFAPDVCHLNNFNFQLTPSIILEIVKWRKQKNKKCKIVYTAHDYQLVCPNHMCYNINSEECCEKCLGGRFINCISNKCIHGSFLRSGLGAIEGYFWKLNGVYRYIDIIICCSKFIKSKLDTNPLFAEKTVVLHNFIDENTSVAKQKEDYVLYFGRYSKEKGIKTLIGVAKSLPQINFVFAGSGPLVDEMNDIANIRNVGFKKGDELKELIQKAKFTVYPSEWYENCPFSVMESQMYGTPVIGADIGGIPELIDVEKTGELFQSGNAEELKNKIFNLYEDEQKLKNYTENCGNTNFDTIEEYCSKLIEIYSLENTEG